MDYFRIIPENFFSLLASKNKRVYLSLILEAFKIYENASILGIEKKTVVDELVHYLETNKYMYECENLEDDEANPNNNRDLANYALRRMEECGWIYVDVSHDYEEILNFSDVGITMCEAIISMMPTYYDNDYTDGLENNNKSEYQGYIYTIYSLLCNNENIEYGFIMSEVLRNTKLLLRSIRKLDARIKDYISSVFENTDAKDLIENLVNYRQDFVENGYAKLKMSDNINRYRLRIVTRLEEYQNSEDIMREIAVNYGNDDDSLLKVNRDIDEIIDIFNSLDGLISAIDEKSKDYVNATIAKIKFLVSEDDNVIGKLNRILRYIKNENKNNHIDRAIKNVNEIMNLADFRHLSENSLYVPRGAYKRNFNLLLDNSRLADFDIDTDFFAAYKAPYQEDVVYAFLDDNFVDNIFKGSNIINYDSNMDLCMLTIYAILYALENDSRYDITVLEERIVNKYLRMRDFIIRKRDEDNA